jgi:hypothetical protein
MEDIVVWLPGACQATAAQNDRAENQKLTRFSVPILRTGFPCVLSESAIRRGEGR